MRHRLAGQEELPRLGQVRRLIPRHAVEAHAVFLGGRTHVDVVEHLVDIALQALKGALYGSARGTVTKLRALNSPNLASLSIQRRRALGKAMAASGSRVEHSQTIKTRQPITAN